MCQLQRHCPPEAAEHSGCIPQSETFNRRHACKRLQGLQGGGKCHRKPCLSLALTNERTTYAQHSRPPYAATHRTHPLHIHSLSHTRPGLPLWQFYKQTSAQSPRAHHTTNISQITSVLFSDSPSSCSYTYGGSEMRQPQPLSGELSLTFPRAFLSLSSSTSQPSRYSTLFSDGLALRVYTRHREAIGGQCCDRAHS